MTFTYYRQRHGKVISIRRYPNGEQAGERWHHDRIEWTSECSDRRSCELTGDDIISEEEAQNIINPPF